MMIFAMIFSPDGIFGDAAPDLVVPEPEPVAVATPDPTPTTPTPTPTPDPKKDPAPTDPVTDPTPSITPDPDPTPTTPPVRVASAPTADDIVDKVQEFYKDADKLTAKFRQTYKNVTFGTTKVSDGKVWIKKPGKMRWDYKGKGKKSKTKKSFISDGTNLWAVEHDNKQVIKKDLEENMLPVAITFLYGKGDLKEDFIAALDTSNTYGTKKDIVLELTPKTPSAQYKLLYLVVDPDDHRVKQSIVHEASGNTNHFRFYEPNTTKAVKDSWFVFNEKKYTNYRIVDDLDKKKKKK
jgi:outer membrane lipoprotein carrier protein